MKQVRKQWLIKPDVQVYLVKRFLFINVVSLILVYFVSTSYFGHLVEAGENAQLARNHPYFTFIKEQQVTYMLWLGWIFLLSMATTIILGFYFSNRFAGPIHNILVTLKSYNSKEVFAPIKLRKSDLLHDLADEVNRLGAAEKH